MASEKEMSLYLRMKADNGAFNTAFKQAEGTVKGFSDKLATLRGGASSAFSIIGGGAGLFFKPLELAAKAAMGLTGALIAVGGASIKAAADDEALVVRLTAVYGSAEKARKVFSEIEKMGRTTMPFDPGEIAEAAMILKQVGIEGAASLQALGDGAFQSGQSLTELATAITMLQSKTLKKLAITLDEKDGLYTIGYMNKMNEQIRIFAGNADEARQKLIGVIGEKGAGAGNALAKSFVLLQNGMNQVIGTFGDNLLPVADGFTKYLSSKIENLLASGKLEEWGKAAGEWLQKAAEKLETVFGNVGNFWADMTSGDTAQKLSDLGSLMVQSFMSYLVAAIEASAAIWKGIGLIAASAFGEAMLQMPNMGPLRGAFARESLKGMSGKEMAAWELQQGVKSGSVVNDLTPEQQASLAMYHKGNMLKSGVEALTTTMPQAFSTAQSGVSEAFRSYGEKNLPRTMGGATINIGTLNVKADNTEKLQNDLLNKAGAAGLNPATT